MLKDIAKEIADFSKVANVVGTGALNAQYKNLYDWGKNITEPMLLNFIKASGQPISHITHHSECGFDKSWTPTDDSHWGDFDVKTSEGDIHLDLKVSTSAQVTKEDGVILYTSGCITWKSLQNFGSHANNYYLLSDKSMKDWYIVDANKLYNLNPSIINFQPLETEKDEGFFGFREWKFVNHAEHNEVGYVPFWTADSLMAKHIPNLIEKVSVAPYITQEVIDNANAIIGKSGNYIDDTTSTNFRICSATKEPTSDGRYLTGSMNENVVDVYRKGQAEYAILTDFYGKNRYLVSLRGIFAEKVLPRKMSFGYLWTLKELESRSDICVKLN